VPSALEEELDGVAEEVLDLVAIERSASDQAARLGAPEVLAGYEGLEIELSPALPASQ